MEKGKILITPRSLSLNGHPAFEKLKSLGYELVFCQPGKSPTEEELLEIVPQCVGWIAGVEPVSERVITSALSLKAISRNGTGVDNLPLDTIEKQGIAVCRAEGANARGVAELAIAMMLSGLRHIPETAEGLKQGQWTRALGHEIQGRVVGVIGMGAIGRQVAQMSLGLGTQVIAYDPILQGQLVLNDDFKFCEVDNLLRQSDIITFHCPAPLDGKPIIGAENVHQLKDGVVIINTARASLVDHDVIYDGLCSGKISVYAVDVYDTEPPANHPLWQHERCIATSHIGGYTQESVDKATHAAVDNLIQVLGSVDLSR
ncbi:phosphoglycerate dehydrogenase [Vibrio nigripulchritudo]|uniref:phosphoglycerate dehydrogenase n=1 Tax=Vibrio nigripulchritudo TaxID=28173 RepID=UPI0005F9A8CC|nr:phosphoglycerate dehydrogenase [Vibrio nigripulchritudo]KJY78751.1 oxidoreductase [Vibrio nigripulchritudo]